MRLGILVNTDRHLGHLVGIAEAAARQGHRVDIFAMDDGVRLLAEELFVGLLVRDGIAITYCDHNARLMGIATDGLPAGIIRGSQYDNSVMHHRCHRVIVL